MRRETSLQKKLSRPLRSLFIPTVIVLAVVAVLMLLPIRLVGESKAEKEPEKPKYGVTYERARVELPDEWTWKVRPVNLNHMYRTEKK